MSLLASLQKNHRDFLENGINNCTNKANPTLDVSSKFQQAEARNNAVDANNDQDKKTTKGKGKSGKNGKDTEKGKEEDVMKGNSNNNNDDEVKWDGDIGGTCDDDNKAK